MDHITKIAVAFTLVLFVSACDTAPSSQRYQRLSDQGLYAGALSTDAGLALLSSQQEGVTLWDLSRQQPKFRWTLPAGVDNEVWFTRFNDNGRLALTASRHEFAIWDTQTGLARGYWSVSDGAIQDIDLSHSGRFVVIALDNAKVIHLDLDSGRRLEFLGHTEKVNSVALSANGRYALSGGNDFQALLWDSQSGQVLMRLVHGSRVTKVALEHAGRYAFTADSRNQARIWRLADGKLQSRLQLYARQQIFSAVRFVEGGRRLLTGSPARQVQVWNSLTGEPLAKYAVRPQPHRSRSSAVVLDVSLDSRALVSLASSGYLEYWPATGVTYAPTEHVPAGNGTTARTSGE